MNTEHLHQIMIVLAAMVLFTSFVLLQQTRLIAAIHAFAGQGILVAMVTAIVAAGSGHTHLFFSAVLTLVLKGILIPWMLHRLVRRLQLDHRSERMHGIGKGCWFQGCASRISARGTERMVDSPPAGHSGQGK